MSNSPPSNRFVLLQALRGLAAMAVLFHNTNFAQHVATGRSNLFMPGASLGEVGVDLFFVLSGFLMVTTTRSDPAGPASAGRFQAARAIRIYPTYWLIAIPWAVVCLCWPAIGGGVSFGPLLQNLLLAPADAPPQLHQAWSLVFEIWFYAVFGLILMTRRRGLLLTLWAVWLLGCAATGYRLPTALGALACNPLGLEFLVGCGLAHAAQTTVRRPVMLLLGGLLCLPLGEFCRFHLPAASANSEIWRTLLTGLPAGAIVLGAVGLEASGQLTAPRWMQALGDRSYALYLVNDPVALSIVAAVAGTVGFAARLPGDAIVLVAALALSLLLAEIAHRLVERPCMQLSRHLRRRSPAPAGVLRKPA